MEICARVEPSRHGTFHRPHGIPQEIGNFGAAARRPFDVLAALLLLVLAVPAMLAIRIVIRRDRGPAIDRHTCIGLGGAAFGCLKFRSMAGNAEEVLARSRAKHPNSAEAWEARRSFTVEPRIIPIGRMRRATSLDELPQLINVLLGDLKLLPPTIPTVLLRRRAT
jgi:exopolysaccharide production protein ExoY